MSTDEANEVREYMRIRTKELTEVLAVLVYWHHQDNGHIDESWWDEAKRLVDEAHQLKSNRSQHNG